MFWGESNVIASNCVWVCLNPVNPTPPLNVKTKKYAKYHQNNHVHNGLVFFPILDEGLLLEVLGTEWYGNVEWGSWKPRLRLELCHQLKESILYL